MTPFIHVKVAHAPESGLAGWTISCDEHPWWLRFLAGKTHREAMLAAAVHAAQWEHEVAS